MSVLWSPITAVTNATMDITGVRLNGGYADRMVHAAAAAEASTQLYRCALLMMAGRHVAGLSAAHASYRSFLGIPESTESQYAKDTRTFGVGFFAVLLSYLPPFYRVSFNSVAISLGTSREDGIAMLETCALQTEKGTVFSVMASLCLALMDIVTSSQQGAFDSQIRERCLKRAKERLTTMTTSKRNVIVQWTLAQIIKRCGDYNKAKDVCVEIMTTIGPYLEGKTFSLNRTPDYELATNIHANLETNNSFVYRIRMDLASTLMMTNNWEAALAVLEPLTSNDTKYVARGLALMYRAGVLAQLDPNDPKIQVAYDNIQQLSIIDSNKKQMEGQMDIVLHRKALQDSRRKDRRLALFDMLYVLGHFGLASNSYLEQVLGKLNETYEPIHQRFSENEENLDFREEYVALLMLRGSIRQYMLEDEDAERDLLMCVELTRDQLFSDPYHLPHALVELGTLYFRQGKRIEAKTVLLEAQHLPEEYIFDRALQMRVEGPLNMM